MNPFFWVLPDYQNALLMVLTDGSGKSPLGFTWDKALWRERTINAALIQTVEREGEHEELPRGEKCGVRKVRKKTKTGEKQRVATTSSQYRGVMCVSV